MAAQAAINIISLLFNRSNNVLCLLHSCTSQYAYSDRNVSCCPYEFACPPTGITRSVDVVENEKVTGAGLDIRLHGLQGFVFQYEVVCLLTLFARQQRVRIVSLLSKQSNG